MLVRLDRHCGLFGSVPDRHGWERPVWIFDQRDATEVRGRLDELLSRGTRRGDEPDVRYTKRARERLSVLVDDDLVILVHPLEIVHATLVEDPVKSVNQEAGCQ